MGESWCFSTLRLRSDPRRGPGLGEGRQGKAARAPWAAWGPGGCESERLCVCACGWGVTVRVGGVHVLVCVPACVSVCVPVCLSMYVCVYV